MLYRMTISKRCVLYNTKTTLRLFCSITNDNKTFNKWTSPTGYDTGILIYNELTKEKVPLILKNKDIVHWYMCGPTVYDSAHIGHACSYMRCDIIRRIMEKFFHLKVIQVMSITDIDDKIILRSSRLNMDCETLTKKYELEFFRDLRMLNISFPNYAAKVTQFIPDIINLIQNLMVKNFAYESPDGSIYFDTQKFGRYGKLRRVMENKDDYDEEMLSLKRSMLDFVLWKKAKPNEPFWNSSLGPGRPGWHSECSAIATNFFGKNVDIHSGGIDLLYPHHENEEAQCCAYHNTEQWVNYWIHTGHLHLTGDVKMSKSLGNTITIPEFLQKYTPNHLRMFCLLGNYANYVEFSDKLLSHAVHMCDKLRNFLESCLSYVNNIDEHQGDYINETRVLELMEEVKISVRNYLAHDFNTEKAIFEIIHMMSEINSMRSNTSMDSVVGRCPATMLAVYSFIRTLLNDFGINFEDDREFSNDNLQQLQSVVDATVTFRSNVRQFAIDSIRQGNEESKEKAKKLLTTCDNFREELKLYRISVKDKGTLSSWNFLEQSKSNEE